MKFHHAALVIIILMGAFASVASEPESIKRPNIVKLGTIDLDLVECTPIVFKDRLYRFEYVRERYKPNTTGDSYFRFIDMETNEPTKGFAKGYHLGSAFVDRDKVYVTGVDIWGGSRIELFVSSDLENWEQRTALNISKYKIYNTSLCKAENGYVMMFEIGAPPEGSGRAVYRPFRYIKRSSHLDRYPPRIVYIQRTAIRRRIVYVSLTAFFTTSIWKLMKGMKCAWFVPRISYTGNQARSIPFCGHSPEDKKIANPKLTAGQRKAIAEAKNINNSDIDFCEYQGRTVILYSWGNQQGKEFLAEAAYAGTEASFIRAWFKEDNNR